MPEELSPLDVRTREQWRRWLSEHHASSPGVWLVRHKQHTGVESLPYEDLVREALCFGWIDSLVKRLDDDRYATKVTPRKPTSVWSDLNRRRVVDLPSFGFFHVGDAWETADGEIRFDVCAHQDMSFAASGASALLNGVSVGGRPAVGSVGRQKLNPFITNIP